MGELCQRTRLNPDQVLRMALRAREVELDAASQNPARLVGAERAEALEDLRRYLGAFAAATGADAATSRSHGTFTGLMSKEHLSQSRILLPNAS